MNLNDKDLCNMQFRVQLSKALVEASNIFETVTPDQRIEPMLKVCAALVYIEMLEKG